MKHLKLSFRSSQLLFFFFFVSFLIQLSLMQSTTTRFFSTQTQSTTTSQPKPTTTEKNDPTYFDNLQYYVDLQIALSRFMDYFSNLNYTYAQLQNNVVQTVPKPIFYYLIYAFGVFCVYILSYLTPKRIIRATVFCPCEYLARQFVRVFKIIFRMNNLRRVTRVINEIIVPPRNLPRVYKKQYIAQMETGMKPITLEDLGIKTQRTVGDQGQSVASATEVIVPQGNIPTERPSTTVAPEGKPTGDLETDTTSSAFSQFSIIKAPAVESNASVTTNCDDVGTMTLSDLLSKNFLLETFNISTTDSTFTNSNNSFRKWTFPAAVSVNKQFDSIFRNYLYARFDIQLKFVVSGSIQQTGLFCATHVPYNPRTIPLPGPVYQGGIGNPLANDYVLLRPNKESFGVLTVPWTSNRPFMDKNRLNNTIAEDYVNNYDTYGSVFFNIILPLTAAPSSSSTCTISVYASFMNLRADVMAIPQMLDTNNVVMIENMRNSVLPNNMTGQKLDAGTFGMDKPSDTRNYEAVVARHFQNLSNCKSTVVSNRLSLVGNDTNEVDTTCYLTNEKHMDREVFLNRYFVQYVEMVPSDFLNDTTLIPWSSTIAGGTLLCTFPISLTGTMALNGYPKTLPTNTISNQHSDNFIAIGAQTTSNLPDVQSYLQTPLRFSRQSPHSFLARQFGYWCGTLKYRLYLATGLWYNGKLFIHVSYGQSSTPNSVTANSDDPRSTYGFEVNANSECAYYDFEVPFRWYCKTAATFETIGQIAIYVDQPLKANNGMPTSINMMVFRAWGDDIVLTDYAPYPYLTFAGGDWHKSVKPKNQTLNTDMCGSYIPIEKMPIPRKMLTDRFDSLKQLLVLPWFVNNITIPNYNKSSYPLILNKLPSFGFFKYFAPWYAGWKGSLRLILRLTRPIAPGIPLKVAWFGNQGGVIATLKGNPAVAVTGNDFIYQTGSYIRSARDYAAANLNVPINPYNGNMFAAPNDSWQCLDGNTVAADTTIWGSFTRNPQLQTRHFFLSDNQPEIVIEIPYRHNKLFHRTGSEVPLGMLVFTNQNWYSTRANWGASFEVSVMAGDDFQFLLPTFANIQYGIDDGDVIPVLAGNATGQSNLLPNTTIVDNIHTTTDAGIVGNQRQTLKNTKSEYTKLNFPPLYQTGITDNY